MAEVAAKPSRVVSTGGAVPVGRIHLRLHTIQNEIVGFDGAISGLK